MTSSTISALFARADGCAVPRVAVLIDSRAIKAAEVARVMALAQAQGEVCFQQVFGSNKTMISPSWKNLFATHELEPKGSLSALGGESITQQIVIDALDLLHQDKADLFILVSRQTKLLALARRLSQAEKTVLGFGGQRWTSATDFTCARFYTLAELTQAGSIQRTATPSNANSPSAPRPRTDDAHRRLLALFVEAYHRCKDSDGVAPLSRLHAEMRILDPSFSMGAYGFAKMRTLVKSLANFEQHQISADGQRGVIPKGKPLPAHLRRTWPNPVKPGAPKRKATRSGSYDRATQDPRKTRLESSPPNRCIHCGEPAVYGDLVCFRCAPT